MQEFISEDDLATFEGWLRYQGFDAAMLAPDELTDWRDMFDKARRDSLATPKVGLMKLPRIPGEYRYAVAVRDGSDLWLTLWVKRSKKGEFFIMVPRQDPGWDGNVVVDLVEPNREPLDWLNVVQKEVFRDTVPWIVIRVCS